MSYNCQIKQQSAQPTLSIRTKMTVQDLPQALGKAYGDIAQYLGQMGEQPGGPPYAAYYNMDMQNLDVEMGFLVSKKLPGKGEIQSTEIPGGKLASCIHIGPYSDAAPAYEALTQHVKDNGYEPSGVAYEMYLNDPAQTPPQELQTQIVFPLKAA